MNSHVCAVREYMDETYGQITCDVYHVTRVRHHNTEELIVVLAKIFVISDVGRTLA